MIWENNQIKIFAECPDLVNSLIDLAGCIQEYATVTSDMIIEIGSNFAIAEPLTISRNSSGPSLTIKSSGGTVRALTRGATGDLFTLGTNAALVLEDIVIDGGRDSGFSSGGGSLVSVNSSSASLDMNAGAVLRNNAASTYGGVYVNIGTFTMTGGKISGNNRSGVYVSYGAFTMSGGEISGNSGNGGVYVAGSGTFTMSGGEISGNSSNGGVYVAGSGTFTMSGGEISGNTTTSGGGGVHFNDSGTFTLGGTAKILGNDGNSGKASNVYLANGIYITLGTGLNAPASGMEVGVRTATASNVIVNSGANSGDKQYFFPDSPLLFVKYDEGKLILAPAEEYLEFSLANKIYNGLPQGIDVSGKGGIGEITVYYEGAESTVYAKSTDAPINAGTYAVTVKIEESEDLAGVDNFALGTYEITKDDPTPIFSNRGNPHIMGVAGYAPTYYNLKGEPQGTTKPATPGIYIEKQGTQTKKIMIR